ncbi:hypothetical protein [Salinisphaera aquimarina]|uniref:Lipoprotein n=1 Tax=Salinisphaera aquimarina TaxID=2094031 RepID=A0ABV7EX62_9GAMM
MHARYPFLIAVLLLSGMLNACANTPPPARASDNGYRPDVTVAVTQDTGMLAQGLSRSLRQHGWTLIGYDADALQGNRDYQSLARRARYRLTLSSDRIGDCRSGEPSFLYNVAMIENASGDVALALTGATCLATAIRDFDTDLRRKHLIVPSATTAPAS